MLKQWTWGVIAGASFFASHLLAIEAATRQSAAESHNNAKLRKHSKGRVLVHK